MKNYPQFAALLMIAAAPLLAHHSIPGHYFMDQNVHLEGEVVEFSYASPHSIVHLQTKDPKSGQPNGKSNGRRLAA